MIHQKIKNEIRSIALTTLYFVVWLGVLVALKKLILAEYHVEFQGLTKALIGAMILAKVVLVLEKVPLGAWMRNRPAWVHVILRTALYAAGTFVVIYLEKTFHARHEHGGFIPSMIHVIHDKNIHQIWANTIAVTFALLVFNALFVIRRHLGKGGLFRIFLAPLQPEPADEIEK